MTRSITDYPASVAASLAASPAASLAASLANEAKHGDDNASDAKSEQSWGIANMAEALGVTPRALRFYEAKGLISPARHGKARVYSRTEKDRIIRILRAKRLGFCLDDIKLAFGIADGLETDPDVLREHSANFTRVVKSLRRRRRDIDIVTLEMKALGHMIDQYLENAPNRSEDGLDGDNVFKFADAYAALFCETMDEGSSPL